MTDFILDPTAVTEERPVSEIRKEKNLGPYQQIVQQSWETDTARGVSVPEAQASKVESKFRQAASALGMGIAIARRPEGDGNVRVVIQAKEKRAYTGRKAGGSRKTGGKTKK
jgi:hypothetical protein